MRRHLYAKTFYSKLQPPLRVSIKKMASLVVNQDSLNRIKSYLNDPLYKEAIEHSASYNTRLCIERKMRLPFLDAQTGVAQNNCTLWMHKRNRMPGERPGQLYTYPAKRWRKRRRQYLVNFLRPRVRDHADLQHSGCVSSSPNKYFPTSVSSTELGRTGDAVTTTAGTSSSISGSAVSSTAASSSSVSVKPDGESEDSQSQPAQQLQPTATTPGRGLVTSTATSGTSGVLGDESKDSWYRDYDDQLDGGDGLDGDEPESDYDDNYEETYTKRKKKKQPATRGTKRRSMGFDPATEQEKPYQCDPGGKAPSTAGGPAAGTATVTVSSTSGGVSGSVTTTTTTSGVPGTGGGSVVASNSSSNSGSGSSTTIIQPGAKPSMNPSPYCDFCLGDANENKKTRQAEELVSCSDCGRSGHPTCLQFTANMMISVKKYRWQCIECKCCTLCGTSDNDDQLLFCDDCDRGYHMYCLEPPLSEPPEGSWSCHLCIKEFHKK